MTNEQTPAPQEAPILKPNDSQEAAGAAVKEPQAGPTDEQIDAERKKFEVWIAERHPSIDLIRRDIDGEYWSGAPDAFWETWQARALLAPAPALREEAVGTVQVMGSYQGRPALGCLLDVGAVAAVGDKLYTYTKAGGAEPSSKTLGSTSEEIFNAIDEAHWLSGPLHERIKELIAGQVRDTSVREALTAALQAMKDWTHIHAPDFCDADEVAAARKRINAALGTLAYIADVNVKLIAALKSLPGAATPPLQGDAP